MSATDSIAGLKVMVIDDSNTIRRSAEIFLSQAGCRVIVADDGFDALAKVSDHEPDLVFCDVLMPRLDGYQTCAARTVCSTGRAGGWSAARST